MVQISSKHSKKGIVFAIAILVVLLPLFLLISSFSDNAAEQRRIYTEYIDANKLIFLERDISYNAYRDLLSINIKSIERASTLKIGFDQAILEPQMDYKKITDNYKNFIEGDYSKLNNVNATLIGFNNTFKIFPYNTTFSINGTALHLFTMPASTNYVEKITLTVRVNSSFKGGCGQPGPDHGSFPSITAVSVTYVNISGGTCTKSRDLDPTENNDGGNGNQFDQDLKEPTGSIETKFGEINEVDGVLAILTSNTVANVTQLDIEYAATNETVEILGGNVSLLSNDLRKNRVIVLAKG